MTMKTNEYDNFFSQVFEDVQANGVNGMLQVFCTLLNEAMKIERAQAIKALPYERSDERQGHANGFKDKTMQTRMGAMTVQVPQVRGMSFYPQSLEKGCRSERALKLAIAEMYVNGVSTRKVSEITEQLCGFELSSTQVSRVSTLLDQELEQFRSRELGVYKYVYLDARYEKVRHDGKVIDQAVVIATGVNSDGRREVIGVSVELSEAEIHWRNFLLSLKARGLHSVELFISDDHPGLKAARKAVFAAVPWQRCQFHFAQNAQHHSPNNNMRAEIGQTVRSIFDASTKEQALDMAHTAAVTFKTRAPKFANWLDENIEECLQIYNLPPQFQKKLRTTNPLELVNREVKRRTNVARIFPNTASLLRLVTAVLVEIHENWLTSKIPYLNIKLLSQMTEGTTMSQQIYRKKVA